MKQKINEQNNLTETLRKILDGKEKEMSNEISEQLETYKNAISKLIEEKEEYLNECQQQKEMIKKYEDELSSIKSNNNSINSSITTNQTDNNNNNKIKDEINGLKQQIADRDGLIETLQGIISGEKEIDLNNINNMVEYKQKLEDNNKLLESYKNTINTLTKEKEKYINDFQQQQEMNKKLEIELQTYKNNSSNKSNEKNVENKEIKNLKDLINEKEKINNNNQKEIKELKTKTEELKNENENIKINSIREHELISSSLYELAIQFITLKEKIDSSQNGNINIGNNKDSKSISWVEIERRKNFPCDYYNN